MVRCSDSSGPQTRGWCCRANDTTQQVVPTSQCKLVVPRRCAHPRSSRWPGPARLCVCGFTYSCVHACVHAGHRGGKAGRVQQIASKAAPSLCAAPHTAFHTHRHCTSPPHCITVCPPHTVSLFAYTHAPLTLSVYMHAHTHARAYTPPHVHPHIHTYANICITPPHPHPRTLIRAPLMIHTHIYAPLMIHTHTYMIHGVVSNMHWGTHHIFIIYTLHV